MPPPVVNSKPFSVLPIGISFHRWASELNVDYSTENIPVPPDEKEWKSWAERVVARNVFNNEQIPFPQGFDDWRSWANRVVQVING